MGSGVFSDSLQAMKCRPSPFRDARRPNLSGPVSFRPRLQDNIESPSAGTDNPLERAKFVPIVLRGSEIGVTSCNIIFHGSWRSSIRG
jgi:hypothetical protein